MHTADTNPRRPEGLHRQWSHQSPAAQHTGQGEARVGCGVGAALRDGPAGDCRVAACTALQQANSVLTLLANLTLTSLHVCKMLRDCRMWTRRACSLIRRPLCERSTCTRLQGWTAGAGGTAGSWAFP